MTSLNCDNTLYLYVQSCFAHLISWKIKFCFTMHTVIQYTDFKNKILHHVVGSNCAFWNSFCLKWSLRRQIETKWLHYPHHLLQVRKRWLIISWNSSYLGGFIGILKGPWFNLTNRQNLQKQENEWQMVYNITNTTYCL